jgi:hypothetical protein
VRDLPQVIALFFLHKHNSAWRHVVASLNDSSYDDDDDSGDEGGEGSGAGLLGGGGGPGDMGMVREKKKKRKQSLCSAAFRTLFFLVDGEAANDIKGYFGEAVGFYFRFVVSWSVCARVLLSNF